MPSFWDSSIRLDLLLSESIGEIKMGLRLDEKLQQAAGVVDRVTVYVEQRADAVIAREAAIKNRTKTIFDAKDAILDDADKGLDGVEAKLALVANDPLPSSGSSPAPAQGPVTGQLTATFRAEAEQQIAAGHK